MYAAPPSVVADVFARIPDRFRRNGQTSEWAQVQLHGAEAPAFLEGPCFDSSGNLWVTDIPWGRLFRIAPGGTVELGAEYDGQPNGLKFLPDGTGLIADHQNGMMRFDPKTGTVTPWITRYLLEPFLGCNDLTIDARGDVWFTDQGQSGLHNPNGRLFRWRAKEDQLDLMLGGIPSPNGLVINKAGTALFLAVTRDNAIWRLPLVGEGPVISKVGAFIRMSGGSGPDGVAIDEDDNLAVCHVGMGSVWLFSRLGEPMLRVTVPDGLGLYTTNCAYGGPDGKTLYFTESSSGTVLSVRTPL